MLYRFNNCAILRLSLPLFATLLVSGCVTIGEAQFVELDDTMHRKTTLYSQCNPGRSTIKSFVEPALSLDPENISLLNWNIFKGQRDNWQRDLHSFIHERDIVTIQEAHLSDELESILAQHDYEWTLNAAFHLNDKPSGVMTASRIPAIDTCGMQHIEPLIRTPKTTLLSYYPIEGLDDTLLVANIHGINFTLGISAYSQQIAHLFEMVYEHDGPVMIAGDFNTWSQARMALILDHAESAGMSSLDYTNHNRSSMFGNALDHVFYRGLEPLEHHSWDVETSDHNPTHVHFRML